MKSLYISLFHGRKDPNEQLDDWGSTGPIIGPLSISITYGAIKIHDPSYNEFVFLPFEDGCVPLDGTYYGDLEIWPDDDPLLAQAKKTDRQVLTFDQFKSLVANMEHKKVA